MKYFIAIIFALFFLRSYSQKVKETFLIPMGFQGRINVIFNQPHTKPIPIENGRRIYRIPDDGILITSSQIRTGFLDEEYYFVDKTGKRIPIPIQDINSKDIPEKPAVVYFGAVGVYGNSSDANPLNFIESIIASKSTSDSIFSQTSILNFEKMIQKKVKRKF